MPSVISKRVSRRFSTRAAPGEKDDLAIEIVEDATVEEVTVRFYPGPQLDLEIRPFVEPDEGNRVSIIDLVGRQNIIGDDDVFEFHVSEAIERGDVIGVEYNNTDPDNGYDVIVDMEIERAGGVKRIMDTVTGWY